MNESKGSFERAARAHIASRGSPGTRKLYTTDLAAWLSYCEKLGVSPDAPGLEAAVQFRDDLIGKYQPSVTCRILSALCSMYEAADLYNPFSPRRLIRPSRDDTGLTQAFSVSEVEALLRTVEAEAETGYLVAVRDAAVMRMMADHGMRVGTVLGLQRSRVRVDGDVVTVFVRPKKKGFVEVALTSEAGAALLRWIEASDKVSSYVFPASDGRRSLDVRVIGERVVTYGKRCGIKGAHPHRFRAAFITTALDIGIPLHEVQAAVHHADPKMTLRYDRSVRGGGVANAVAEARKKRA